MQHSAVQVALFSELAMYGLTSLATVVGMLQMRKLWFDSSRTLELDSLLLVVAQTGVFLYSAFSIIGASSQVVILAQHWSISELKSWTQEIELTPLLASLLTLSQATLQTLFILDASRRLALLMRDHQSFRIWESLFTFWAVMIFFNNFARLTFRGHKVYAKMHKSQQKLIREKTVQCA